MNNIRSFRENPTPINKIGVALAYIIFGWVVTIQPIMEYGGLLSLFMIIGIVMWIFVIQKRNIKYYLRFHLTQALLLNVAFCAALWLIIAAVSLFLTLPLIKILMSWTMAALFNPINVFNTLHASVKDLIIMTTALYLAITAFRGQYTELPMITEGVRHWL